MIAVMANNHFKSKTDAMNRRVHCWMCLKCGVIYIKKQKQCTVCFEKEFQYFPSKAEYNRYNQLTFQLSCKLISDLELQPSFPIVLNGKKVFTYKADFAYTRDGQRVIEDVKGSPDHLTDVFELKRKVVEAVYNIQLTIT